MKMELDASGAHIALKAPPNAATIVRQIPGARHDAKRQTWLLPVSWATCVVARAVVGDELQIGPRLREWAVRERQGRIDPALAMREAKDLMPDSPWGIVLDQEVEVAE